MWVEFFLIFWLTLWILFSFFFKNTGMVSFTSMTKEQIDAAANLGIKAYSWNEFLQLVSFLRLCYIYDQLLLLLLEKCTFKEINMFSYMILTHALWLFMVWKLWNKALVLMLISSKYSFHTFFWFLSKWANLDQGKEFPSEPIPPRSLDICTIMYTSGTSGDPKGVILTHECHATCVRGIDLYMEQFEDKVSFSVRFLLSIRLILYAH